jgi:hypothetical protein
VRRKRSRGRIWIGGEWRSSVGALSLLGFVFVFWMSFRGEFRGMEGGVCVWDYTGGGGSLSAKSLEEATCNLAIQRIAST